MWCSKPSAISTMPTTTKKLKASILMVGWLDTNSPIPRANTIMRPTDVNTAAIMISIWSTMPTAVMMESREKTKSISMI